MTPKNFEEENKVEILKAFKNFKFEPVTYISEIYSKSDYDVPEINLEIKENYSDKLSLLMDEDRQKKSTLVLPIVGTAGSGKTHLLNYFYSLAREKNGFFCATEFYETEKLLERIIEALFKSMKEKDLHGKTQLSKLLDNIIVESNVKIEDLNSNHDDFIKYLSPMDRNKIIDKVADGLFQKFRSEFSNHYDVLKAVFFLSSMNFKEVEKASLWLQSRDVKEIEPKELKFNKSHDAAYNILKGLTWLMTLNNGFSVIVIDQMDSILGEGKKSDDNTVDNYKDLGFILSKLATDTYKTLTVLSTHSDAWFSLVKKTLKSYVDRFYHPVKLNPVTNPDYLEKIIELRVTDAYHKVNIQPPYPTYPFPKQFFESLSGNTPRELLKKCDFFVKQCLKNNKPEECY
jgi:hypothetical protein